MIAAFLVGVAAGYAIAIPVGPIAVLILRTGLERGFAAAAAAGAGAATADLLYAAVAMLFGAAASAALTPILPVTRILAAAVLAAIAIRGLLVTPGSTVREAGARSTYLRFVGLTLLNPPTVVYFVSLAIALPEVSQDLSSRLAFVAGAFLASLSWQEVLAFAGAGLHARLGPAVRRAAAIVSSIIILALAARIAVG